MPFAVRRAETTASSTADASRSRTSGAASLWSSGVLVMSRNLDRTTDGFRRHITENPLVRKEKHG
jgi:hypothetical protein